MWGNGPICYAWKVGGKCVSFSFSSSSYFSSLQYSMLRQWSDGLATSLPPCIARLVALRCLHGFGGICYPPTPFLSLYLLGPIRTVWLLHCVMFGTWQIHCKVLFLIMLTFVSYRSVNGPLSASCPVILNTEGKEGQTDIQTGHRDRVWTVSCLPCISIRLPSNESLYSWACTRMYRNRVECSGSWIH